MEFKIKMINSKQLSEIDTRRIIVDTESFSFHDFSCYLKSLFNLHDTDDLHIKVEESNKWIDTEEEWKDFVGSFNTKEESLIKLKVYHGNVHVNITCDNCNDVVVGDRYKCLQCDDHDICQKCFQNNPGIHSEHCFLLLRKQEDSRKFLRSVPLVNQNQSDFRVIDVNVDYLMNEMNISKAAVSTQTEETSKSDNDGTNNIDGDKDNEKGLVNLNVDKNDKFIQQDGVKNIPLNTDDDKQKTCINNSNEVKNNSSNSKSYFDNLPKEILDGLEKLQGMGFINMDETLIALLVATNGNILQVLEELDYSSKH